MKLSVPYALLYCSMAGSFASGASIAADAVPTAAVSSHWGLAPVVPPPVSPAPTSLPVAPDSVKKDLAPVGGLHFALEAPGCSEAVDFALDNFYRFEKYFPLPEMANRSSLDIQSPIGQYTLNPADVLSGKGLAAAKLTGFLYEVRVTGTYVAYISVFVNASGESGRTMGLFNLAAGGHSSYDVFKAEIARLGLKNQLQKDTYELRFLTLPPYRKSANHAFQGDPAATVIWLKSDLPGGDLIFMSSSDSKDPSLKAGVFYKAEDMLKAILPSTKRYVESLNTIPAVSASH